MDKSRNNAKTGWALPPVVKNMSVKQKLAFLGFVFMIPLLLISSQWISYLKGSRIGSAQQEISGVEYLAPVRKLLEHVQEHGGMSTALLSGDTSFKDKLVAKKREIENDLAAVETSEQKLGALSSVTSRWQVSQSKIKTLLSTTGGKAQENFDRHAVLTEDIQSFMTEVGDATNLTLDADLDSYYLMGVVVNRLPALTTISGQARALGSGVLARGTRTDEEKAELLKLFGVLELHTQNLSQAFERAFAANPTLRAQLEPYQKNVTGAGNKFSEVLNRQLLTAPSLTLSAAEYFNLATNSIQAAFALYDQTSPALESLLRARISKFSWQLYFSIFWIIAGIALVTFIGLAIVRDLTDPLSMAAEVAEQVAAGDLSVLVSADNRQDEAGMLLKALQKMVRSLQEMARVAEKIAEGDLAVTVQPQSSKDVMGNVLAKMVKNFSALAHELREGVTFLGSISSEILTAIAQVAAGAAETASAVTETATTVEEVKQTALVASQKAKSVADASQATVQISHTGEQAVEEAVSRMERIREQMESIADSVIKLGEQSRAIGEIINAVNDLADQSNLLAVNAAIEAANAGDYGRGFAVVAQEVKNLADQSKQATAQVRSILSDIQKATNVAVMVTEQGTKAVEAGVAQSVEAGGSIQQLARSMADAAQAVTQIAASSQQQLVGMDQVVTAVESIKEASNQNVASMSQVETSMQQLYELGQRLQGMVGRYRLNGVAA